jgi:hypothetical protein
VDIYLAKTQKEPSRLISEGEIIVKKAVIEISLVDECSERKNNEIANEIFGEISEGRSLIPWCKQVNKVIVVDSEKLY